MPLQQRYRLLTVLALAVVESAANSCNIKVITAICHGAWLLVETDSVKGKTSRLPPASVLT